MNEQIKTLIAGKTLHKRLKWRMLNSKLLDVLPGNLQTSINFIQFECYKEISTKLFHPSTSPKCYWTLLKTLPLITHKSLSGVDFSIEDIKSIISKLVSNKAHSDVMISIRMLKLHEKSIRKSLSIIFQYHLTQGIFPSKWKNANVLRIH